jgi:hypothetical protein
MIQAGDSRGEEVSEDLAKTGEITGPGQSPLMIESNSSEV